MKNVRMFPNWSALRWRKRFPSKSAQTSTSTETSSSATSAGPTQQRLRNLELKLLEEEDQQRKKKKKRKKELEDISETMRGGQDITWRTSAAECSEAEGNNIQIAVAGRKWQTCSSDCSQRMTINDKKKNL